VDPQRDVEIYLKAAEANQFLLVTFLRLTCTLISFPGTGNWRRGRARRSISEHKPVRPFRT